MKSEKESKFDYDKTVCGIIEKCREDICDSYCKYPSEYPGDDAGTEQLFEDRCNFCPLFNLI